MITGWLWRLLSFGFISSCLFLGINIGNNIRLGQLQSEAVTTPSEVPIADINVGNNIRLGQLQSEAATTPIEVPIPDIPSTSPPLIEPNYDDTITIQAVGDVIPGTNYPDYRLPRDRNQLIPKSVRAYLQRADILFGNFETSLTNHPNSAKDINQGQIFAFRSPPSYAKLFSDVGFDVFNIANNHALDFGVAGFQDTNKNLNAVGIKTLGHKNQILLLQSNNIPIAMIGFAPYKNYNSIHELQAATALVKKAKTQAKIVIVSMHAGAEGTNALNVKNQEEFFYGENRGNSIKFARTMIDAGADLVIGHGPHVPRAVEIYNNKLIAYSLGNFLGYRTLSTAGERGYSMILEVKLNSQGDLVSSKIIPVHIDKQGIPHIDQRFRTVGLLRSLINQDFPENAVKINKKGEIVVRNSEFRVER